MMDYVKELLLAVNNYNESNPICQEKLRDLVCIISENKKLKEDPVICDLLYIASQKMRVFGYNIQNGFKENPDKKVTFLNFIRDEAIKSSYRSKVRTNNILDKSQKEVVDFFQALEIKRMLVSAPTSYGKTFLMREILFLNHERYNTILLVFPTVALLRENALEMESFVREKELEYNVIKAVDGDIDLMRKNIFVFTPERAMQLLAFYPDITIDFFFFDEVYKIDEDYCYDDTDEKTDTDGELPVTFLDNSRAKTFRIALYLLAKRVNEYYLAGPNLNQNRFGIGMKLFLQKNKIKVKEVDFEPTMRIPVKAFSNKIEETCLLLPSNQENTSLSKPVNDKIRDVVNYINQKKYGKTMLYCTTPAKANGYASKLSENREKLQIKDLKFELFLEHIKRIYDIDNSIKDWSFINVLEKGFGLHHGKLPKYIQTEVLDQFNNGVFDILFCTSTIIEGVNTKAQNMVILNTTKGREPLTPFDIKNIKGRAGRYYHNFIGRIFYMHKELLEIENSEDLALNFATYADNILDSIDLDNAEQIDLSETNRSLKIQRDTKLKHFKLPDEVFKKNRLVPKEYQESLLNLLVSNQKEFSQYEILINNNDLTENFLKYNYLAKVLNTFVTAKLIDERTMKRFAIIGKTYYHEGFQGILKYEIGRARDPEAKYKITIDQAYSNGFKTLKDIIEHKIPKILTLFENIYICAAQFRHVNASSFSLSRVIRFYETGVRSPFGEQLIEFGYPVDTIRYLERSYPFFLKNSVSEAKEYYLRNKEMINVKLDSYEQVLLNKALNSIN